MGGRRRIRSPEVGSGPDRREQIVHKREMQHLLGRDMGRASAPARYGFELVR